MHKSETGTITGIMFGTDADALTIDGPPPVLAGWQPVTNKKGEVIGQKPVYSTNAQPGQTALLASYGMNNSKAFGKGANVVTTTALGMVAAGVQKAKDSATAANEAKQIAASEKAADNAAKLASQQEANRHAEKLMEFEVPAAAAPVVP